MINLEKSLWICLPLCVFSPTVKSQIPKTSNNTKREGDLADRRKTLDKLNTDAERLGEKRQYKAPVWRLPEMSYEETVKARKRIAPDAADLTKFKDFLRIYIERLTVKKL